MKRQWFYCFINFAQNADIHTSGQQRNSTLGPKREDSYLYNGQLSTSRCAKTVIIFQQHFVFNIEIKGSVSLIVPETWEHYQIQCRLEVTRMHAGNRCWQIMTSRPRGTVNQQTRWTRKIQRKASPFGYSLSQSIYRTWRHMCSHIPLKRELRFGRRCFKSGDTKTEARYSCLLPQKPKEIQSANRKQSRAQSPQRRNVNLGTITETLSWCKFSPLSGIRVKPKLHRRRRRIYEILQKPSQKPKVIHTDK